MRTGDPDSARDFTDVRDIVRAYAAAAGLDGGAFNVCSGRAATVPSSSRWSRPTPASPSATRSTRRACAPTTSPRCAASPDRLTEATGWQPEIPLDQTVRDTLDWWRGAAQLPAGRRGSAGRACSGRASGARERVRAALRPRRPRRRGRPKARQALGEGAASPRGTQRSSPISSGRPPIARRHDRHARRPSPRAPRRGRTRGSARASAPSRRRRAAPAPRRARARPRKVASARRARARAPRAAPRSGPSPAMRSGTPAARRGLDRDVDPLLRREPRRRPARSRPRRRASARRSRPRAGSGAGRRRARAGSPRARQLPGGPGARRDETVDRPQRERLVQRQPGRVGGGLRQRAAAVEREPGSVLRPRQRKQGRAVARGRRRSRRTAARCAGAAPPRPRVARGGEAARADQRLHVVGVHDVGAEVAHGRRDLLPARAAAQQGARRPRPPDVGRAALEQRGARRPRASSARSWRSTERSSPPSMR